MDPPNSKSKPRVNKIYGGYAKGFSNRYITNPKCVENL